MKRYRFTSNDDCVIQTGHAGYAIPFDVSDWTFLFALPDFSLLTTPNTRPIFNNPIHEQLPVYWARAQVCLQDNGSEATIGGPPGARFRMMHYEGDNPPVAIWEPFGEELFMPATGYQFMASPPATIVTDEVNALNHQIFRQWTVQVKGKGYLTMARLQIIYTIDDYSDEIGALMQRVAALEGQAAQSAARAIGSGVGCA